MKHVYSAISAVQADIARIGVEKDKKNAQHGYAFRGIDAMYNALAPILAKHRLVIIPRLASHKSEEHESRNGGKMFRVVAEYEFDFVSAEDGSVHTARMAGEAMDASDKSTNKTASAAYKYVCMQVFCIPTDVDDADSESPEAAGAKVELTPAQKLQLAEAKIEGKKTDKDWLVRNHNALCLAEADFASCPTDFQIVKEKFEAAIKALEEPK